MSVSLMAAHAIARAYLADTSGSTIAEHRDRRTNAFALALLLIWREYGAGTISRAVAEREISALVSQTAGEVLAAYALQHGVSEAALHTGRTAHLIGQAMARAGISATSGLALWTPGTAAPSEALALLRSNQAAGPIWGLHFVAEGAALAQTMADPYGTWEAQDDDRVCAGCGELDGKRFRRSEMPTYPGYGDTECGNACRCLIAWDAA